MTGVGVTVGVGVLEGVAGTGVKVARRVTVEGQALAIPVEAFRSRLVLLERGTAKVLAATPGAPIGP